MMMKIADFKTMMRMILEIIMVSLIMKKLERLINMKKRNINDDLLRKYFLVQDLRALLEKF